MKFNNIFNNFVSLHCPMGKLFMCALLVVVLRADETCTVTDAPTAWPATGCGIEDLQAIVVDDSDVKYLVRQDCALSEDVCSTRTLFRTRDSCGQWTVHWYAASQSATFPASLGLIPSCRMPASTTVRRTDGSVATASFYAVNDKKRRGFTR